MASTSKKSIEEFRYTEPAIALVFDCRERQHNRDTYCNDVLSRVPENHPADNDTIIIHSNFNSIKIPTGRLATSDPNILGIPTRTELGRKVRDCYIAPPGKIWCGFDLSGVEVRCLAHLSRDPLLINVFTSRINPHKDTASRLFNVPICDVTDLQKAVAKTINFLVIYGGGASNLFDQFRSNNIKGYTLDDCRQFIRKWFATYSGVDAYRRRVIAEAKQAEEAYDHWGRVRHFPGINCGDAKIEGEEGRAAVSLKVQGLARGILRNASVWLFPRLLDLIQAGELDPACIRLDVHDELVYLVNEGKEETLGPLVLHALTKHAGINLCVPIEAEAHFGYTWGELK
jgi:DNA polymerase-1